MIDLNACDEEIKTALQSILSFKSIETGHIRSDLPLSQMPGLDISTGEYQYDHSDTDAQYKAPCIVVIRRNGPDMQVNAKAFKDLIKSVGTILEVYKGTNFRVIRKISGSIQETASGTNSMIRAGVFQFELWA